MHDPHRGVLDLAPFRQAFNAQFRLEDEECGEGTHSLEVAGDPMSEG